MKSRKALIVVLLIALLICPLNAVFGSNGYLLHGVGAVNESLGGAGVSGNAQDVIGSLNRNPANGLVFNGTMMSFGFGALLTDVSLASSLSLPGLTMKGSSNSEVDLLPIASFAVVHNNEKTPVAYYCGVIPEAGFGLKLDESMTNPILIPQADKPNNPLGGLFGGFGEVETRLELVRIPFGVSYQLNSKLSGGVSIAPAIQRMKFSPGAFADPDDANGNGIPTYPTVKDNDVALGIGFQAGAGYQVNDDFRVGLSITSPTWLQKHEWDVKDELGNKREISFKFNRPLSIRLGTGYQLTPKTLMLVDAEWVNYSKAAGFDKTGFSATGALKGLGWDDAWVFAMGAQHSINEDFIVRAGYNYGSNPIDAENTFYNVGSFLHVKHHLSCGGSYRITRNAFLDVAYTHVVESSQKGPFQTPAGAAPGTQVDTSAGYDQITINGTISF